jgi:hypothetical protein
MTITTSVPSCSVAACAWPMDAHARGSGSKVAKLYFHALKLASDNVLDDLRGNTRSGVLELGEARPGSQAGASQHAWSELAKRDERRPELLESRTQLLGRRVGLHARSATQQALFQRQQAPEAEDVDQIDHAVTSQDLRDLQLATVGRFHRRPVLMIARAPARLRAPERRSGRVVVLA